MSAQSIHVGSGWSNGATITQHRACICSFVCFSSVTCASPLIAKAVRRRRASTGEIDLLRATGSPDRPIVFQPRDPVYLSNSMPKPEAVNDPIHVDADLLRLRQECKLMPDVSVRGPSSCVCVCVCVCL